MSDRIETVNKFAREEYGFLPPKIPTELTKIGENNHHFGGMCLEEDFELNAKGPKGEHKFPVRLIVPRTPGKHKLFVFLNFDARVYTDYFPLQSVMERNFAVAYVYYNDISSDDGDMTNGLAGVYERPTDGTGWGKLSIWARGASLVLDALEGRQDIDFENVAIIGHSRLGKTALWCAANDTRFKFACVNDSGCSGAAYARRESPYRETIEKITNNFPYWFCENYLKYRNNEAALPFDQDELIAAVCPRFVCVASGSLDAWACPEAELESCVRASKAWEQIGRHGYIGKAHDVNINERFIDGDIGYFLREGTHFLALGDWRYYMDFIDKHGFDGV